MRVSNWPSQYHRAVANARLIPFRWGVHDCVLFSAYVVDSISDLDVTPKFKARYHWHNEESAQKIIEQAGGLSALVCEFLGPPVSWTLLSTGDVVLAKSEEKILLAIHDGHNLLYPGVSGIAALPLSCALHGWRV
jgi:hypothetical protein